VVISIYTGKAPKGALSQPEKNHQLRHFYLLVNHNVCGIWSDV
jgi:hypothetical protein